jgi:hypothetical protein
MHWRPRSAKRQPLGTNDFAGAWLDEVKMRISSASNAVPLSSLRLPLALCHPSCSDAAPTRHGPDELVDMVGLPRAYPVMHASASNRPWPKAPKQTLHHSGPSPFFPSELLRSYTLLDNPVLTQMGS